MATISNHTFFDEFQTPATAAATHAIDPLHKSRIIRGHATRSKPHGWDCLCYRRSADHFHLRGGAILQAVQDQLDARRDAELVKNPKKIISNDRLLAGGWRARKVAI